MNSAQTMIDDARILFSLADELKETNEKLRLIKQAVDFIDIGARIRNEAIEMQLEEIKEAVKRFDARLPHNHRLF